MDAVATISFHVLLFDLDLVLGDTLLLAGVDSEGLRAPLVVSTGCLDGIFIQTSNKKAMAQLTCMGPLPTGPKL